MSGRTLSRRLVIGLMGSGVVALPLIGRSTNAAALSPSRESIHGLVAPLVAGARLARWTLVNIGSLTQGAATLTLAGDDGHQFRLELMARDDNPLATQPPALTRWFAIYVCNGGDGWLPTDEEQGLAAMTLAQVVAANEQRRDAEGFLTHAQRLAQHREALLGVVDPPRG